MVRSSMWEIGYSSFAVVVIGYRVQDCRTCGQAPVRQLANSMCSSIELRQSPVRYISLLSADVLLARSAKAGSLSELSVNLGLYIFRIVRYSRQE
jgi:hypothetical protein